MSRGSIICIVGTGTGVGKTHVAAALLRQLRAGGALAVGWKPVESGVAEGGAGRQREGEREGEDELALHQATGVHCPTLLRLREPISPHLAARRQGARIDGAAIERRLEELSARWPLVVLELAGGWFSPFDDARDNADWLAALPAALRARLRLVLVAPDRLGVLHDVSAVVRAAASLRPAPLAPLAVALSAPAQGDDASGSNAAELTGRGPTRGLPVLSLPRAPVEALAQHPTMRELAALVSADR